MTALVKCGAGLLVPDPVYSFSSVEGYGNDVGAGGGRVLMGESQGLVTSVLVEPHVMEAKLGNKLESLGWEVFFQLFQAPSSQQACFERKRQSILSAI